MSEPKETAGDRIAREFSTDKVHLAEAEQRRLAGMIDDEFRKELKASAEAERVADRIHDSTIPSHQNAIHPSADSVSGRLGGWRRRRAEWIR